jgi:hypothetical protein
MILKPYGAKAAIATTGGLRAVKIDTAPSNNLASRHFKEE